MAVVDIEVIKAQTTTPSTGTPSVFRDQLLQRDICCIFTGFEPRYGDGIHIIPFKRGSEVCSYIDSDGRLIALPFFFQWFRLIVQNRPHEEDDDLVGLKDISDVRNGLFAATMFRRVFDARELVILKVCANLFFP